MVCEVFSVRGEISNVVGLTIFADLSSGVSAHPTSDTWFNTPVKCLFAITVHSVLCSCITDITCLLTPQK